MLEGLVNDYSAYLKVDVINGFQSVQDIVDNMLTRLEELTSVLQMVKLKNSDCVSTVSDDINKYRSEITQLSKKIATLNSVVQKLQSNIDVLEKQVEKAELDFGVNTDNKIKTLLKPFLKRNRDNITPTVLPPYNRIEFDSVMDNFHDSIQ